MNGEVHIYTTCLLFFIFYSSARPFGLQGLLKVSASTRMPTCLCVDGNPSATSSVESGPATLSAAPALGDSVEGIDSRENHR